MAHTLKREGREHKRGVVSPRLVKLLGADARLAVNDEPEIDRGPLTVPAELTEADWIAADLAEDEGKAQRRAGQNDRRAAALDLQHLDAMRRAGL